MISWFEKHYKVSVGITLFGALAIFFLSSLSFGPGTSTTSFLSILYHFLAFFCFSGFVLISLLQGKKKYGFLIWGILFSFAYALTDEIHQFFVPGRSLSYFDILLDSAGIIFAVMIYLILLEIRKR